MKRLDRLTNEQLGKIFSADPDGYREVEWRHFKALLGQGLPADALVQDGDFTFRVARKHGREFAVFEL